MHNGIVVKAKINSIFYEQVLESVQAEMSGMGNIILDLHVDTDEKQVLLQKLITLCVEDRHDLNKLMS